MIVKFLFSSPKGDLPLDPDIGATPFKITPDKSHPFLTLNDYFEAMKAFVLKDDGKPLTTSLRKHLSEDLSFKQIRRLLIRSEKHGALYHVASVDIIGPAKRSKLSVSTAVSERGKCWLNREYDILKELGETHDLSYLPKVYFKGDMDRRVGKNRITLSMFLGEWFEDYHEWHLSIHPQKREQRICMWDLKKGHRFASRSETYEIYEQAAKILTLYYDTRNFRQIYPWHHAAGDFVVRTSKGGVEVKLATAREYKPFMTFLKEEQANPLVAIVYFLFNMTLKTRLDKLDGVGDTAWAGGLSVEATVKGFFEALRIMEKKGGYSLGKVEDLRSLLTSFSQDEIWRLFQSLLVLYREEDPGDLLVIEKNLESHVEKLYQVMQRFHV
ncbi:MAG: hypothetical protein GY849_12085 [Deltaproteobacteria bacterium]|nr:hypothetical protein [Deltaproteobacteria bacterium]